MDRRKFLQQSGLIAAPLILNGIPLYSQQGVLDPFLQALSYSTALCGKVLIIVQLNGGNDGLNTVIPLDKYSVLSTARQNILIPSGSVLPIPGTSGATGLHPAMSGMLDLYNNDKLAIIQGVSYPNPNFSHFFAQDIWFSGTNPATSTGWVGRAFDDAFPNYPTGYPNNANPDPPAIQLSGNSSLALNGQAINYGYNVPNPNSLINVATASPGPVPTSDYGTELAFLRLMKDQSNVYINKISNAYNGQQTMSTMYPTNGSNLLADQLKIVARLIGGGLQTPVYIVNHPNSFDTHVNQVNSGNTVAGAHTTLLSRLSVAISAFMDDISLMGKGNKVTGMTYSEFGRRVMSNNNTGTDHGTAAPVFVFGNTVKGGVYGQNANLPATVNVNTQIPTEFDFREIYKTVLMQTMCLSETEANAALGNNYNVIDLFDDVALSAEYIKLQGYFNGSKVDLTFDVLGNDLYEVYYIEYSKDALTYETVNKQVRTNMQPEFTYQVSVGRKSGPTAFYRIKGITADGYERYSNVLRLSADENRQEFSVYPNPVKDFTINIDFFNTPVAPVDVAIYSVSGSRLYYNQMAPNAHNKFQVPNMFDSQTIYILKVTVDGTTYNEKIVFE